MDMRWSVRQQDGSGFLFMNNYQDHVAMPDRDIQLELHTSKGTVLYPREGTMQLKSGMAAILPFHMNLSGMKIISATVQPLTRFMVNQELTAVFMPMKAWRLSMLLMHHLLQMWRCPKVQYQSRGMKL